MSESTPEGEESPEVTEERGTTEEAGLQGPEDVGADESYEGPSDTSPGNVGPGNYS